MTTENLNQQITNNVPEFFFIWDIESQKIIHLTQGLNEYARRELIEEPDYARMVDFVHPEYRDKFEEILRSFSVHDTYQDHDLRVNEEKYRAKWLNIKTFPAEDDHGRVVRVVAHISDITKRKEELSALEDLNEKNESVIRILAHDLKSPINNMFMLAHLAERQLKDGDKAQVHNMIQLIRSSAQGMGKLVESMLELMELTDSRLSAEMHQVNFASLIKNAVEDLTPQFEEHRIRLIEQYPEKTIFARLDAQKFQHVVSNLLSNALKFTPESGEVTIAIREEEEQVLFEVSDTGIGISEDKRSEIFKEFSSARRKGLRGENSSGLGLSIVKKIVSLHQGTITVKSSPGIGTTFLVALPHHQQTSSAD